MLLKSDNEPAILELKELVSDNLPGVEVVPKEAPVGDSRANGAAENAVKLVKGQVRCLKTAMEDLYGCRLESDCCLLAWMPRHCASLMTRFKVYTDGKTAVQRLTGRRWGRPLVVFGERILVKVAASRPGRRAGLGPNMVPAIYVGHHGRSGAMMALTQYGAVKARSFRKLPEEERFMAGELKTLKGLPWALNDNLAQEMGGVPLIARRLPLDCLSPRVRW